MKCLLSVLAFHFFLHAFGNDHNQCGSLTCTPKQQKAAAPASLAVLVVMRALLWLAHQSSQDTVLMLATVADFVIIAAYLWLAHQEWHEDSTDVLFEDDRENDAAGNPNQHDTHPHSPASISQISLLQMMLQ